MRELRALSLVAVLVASIACTASAQAQSLPPQPRPAATPVVLGSNVTGAIGQHTAEAVRQGLRTEIAVEAPRVEAPNLLPSIPSENIARR